MSELHRRLRRITHGDQGSALVLALLVVLLVGAMLAATLQYQQTGFLLAPQMRNDRNAANYVQGAVEGAVNQIRGSSDYGSVSVPTCPPFQPLVPAGLSGVSGHTFRVDCTPQPAPGGGSADDAPPYAIRTVGTGSDGISITGNKLLYIDGPIYSSGVISVASNAALRVNGSVDATGACTGPITTTDRFGTHCNPAAGPPADPAYLPALANQAGLDSLKNPGADLDTGSDPLPTCSGDRITFSPGYYGTAPDALVNKLLPTCGGKLWEFTPGVYYFDYTGNWLIKGYQVIGGTVDPSQTSSDALGSACTPTALSPTNHGVQFVFGGAGTISTQSSSGSTVSGIELCGPPLNETNPGSPQRLVLYGLGPDNTSTTAETVPAGGGVGGVQTLSADTGPTPSPADNWTFPDEARTINGTVAATVATQFTQNKSTTLSFTLPSSAVPAGAKVTTVTLRVAHTLVNAKAKVTLSSPRLGSPAPFTFNQASCAPCTTDVTSTFTGGNDVPWRLLDKLAFTYTVTADNDTGGPTGSIHSATVDGVDLQVTYTMPTYRQQTCTGGCTFFDSTTNPNVFMHGTVYTPVAGWAVNVHNDGESIFERGVVVRTLAIISSASSKQSTSPFQLPPRTNAKRYVYFQGYVDGVEKLRACVLYDDSGPTTSYAGYAVSVPHWLYLRTPSTTGSSC